MSNKSCSVCSLPIEFPTLEFPAKEESCPPYILGKYYLVCQQCFMKTLGVKPTIFSDEGMWSPRKVKEEA